MVKMPSRLPLETAVCRVFASARYLRYLFPRWILRKRVGLADPVGVRTFPSPAGGAVGRERGSAHVFVP